jgi:hypothetical protein
MNADDATPGADSPNRPLLRIVRGDPTPDELAALVAVMTARMAATAADEPPAPSRYADPTAAHRVPLRVGPAEWVASGWLPGTRTSAAW